MVNAGALKASYVLARRIVGSNPTRSTRWSSGEKVNATGSNPVPVNSGCRFDSYLDYCGSIPISDSLAKDCKMAFKSLEEQRVYKREWYKLNRQKVIGEVVARKKRLRELVKQYKLEKGCTDCGYKEHFAALDFDHISDNKFKGIARMVDAGYSWKRIKQEIDKCEVVCANCHRIRTTDRMNQQ